MNKSNLTRLVINLLAASESARAAGLLETADWLRLVAEVYRSRYPELFVA